jgi:hypothetical protein
VVRFRKITNSCLVMIGCLRAFRTHTEVSARLSRPRPLLSGALLSAFSVLSLLLPLDTALADGKPRVAIETPKLGTGVENTGAARDHLDLGMLTADLEAAIRATRKFDMVSRQEEVLGDIREEQKLAESELFAGDAASSGELANVNYLILPTVRQFQFYRSATPVPNLDGEFRITDAGEIQVSAQLVDTISGQVLATFDAHDSFRLKTRLANSKAGAPSASQFEAISKGVAAQMADQLVDNVFPMKVINTQGSQVWINRGKDGGLKPGDTLVVFSPGEELVDPDTGESLGSAESEVGTIEVTRVNPKFTIAEIKTIDPNTPVQDGFIVRKR